MKKLKTLVIEELTAIETLLTDVAISGYEKLVCYDRKKYFQSLHEAHKKTRKLLSVVKNGEQK